MTQLRGAAKYRKEVVDAGRSKSADMIDRANEIDIFTVLKDFFNIDVPSEGESFKSYCPFGEEHPDQGRDKSWRTYPATNSSYCFTEHGVLTPVRLVQLQREEWASASAEFLLRKYDLLKPKPWRERYALLMERREQSETSMGNPQHAVEALQMALQNVEGYPSRQFDADVREGMEKVLGALEKVFASETPDQTLREWFTRAKRFMTATVKAGL